MQQCCPGGGESKSSPVLHEYAPRGPLPSGWAAGTPGSLKWEGDNSGQREWKMVLFKISFSGVGGYHR